jgi:hypothetical protein
MLNFLATSKNTKRYALAAVLLLASTSNHVIAATEDNEDGEEPARSRKPTMFDFLPTSL